jgi:hypothetical protein
MPAIINSDSGAVSGSAGLKIYGNSDGILEIQNNGVTSLVVANSYIKVPVGNTISRPTAAVAGMLRFNNETTRFEGNNGAGWVNLSAGISFTLEYLVVAGGGGGAGGANGGGAGGAGGFRTGNITTSPGFSYPITVGAGGAGGTSGANGAVSTFSITSSSGGGRGIISDHHPEKFIKDSFVSLVYLLILLDNFS